MAAKAEVEFIGKDVSLGKRLKTMEKKMEKWAGRTKALVGGALAVFSSAAITGFVTSAVSSFNENEKAATKLNSVLKATAGAAGFTAEELENMAGSLEATFTGAANTNAQALLLTFKEVKKEGNIFEDAMIAAQDMATVLDSDLNAASIQLGKALNNPIVGMAALADSGVSFTQDQKDLIKTLQESGDMMGAQRVILDELAGEFGGAASDQLDTFSGKMQVMQNFMGGKMAVAGEFFAGVLTDMLGGAVFVFTGIEVAVTNFKEAYELAYTQLALTSVSTWNNIGHTLTVVIPAWLDYLLENWLNIFKTLGSFLIAWYTNMAKNALEFFTSLWGMIAGDGGSWEFTPMLEGFESAMTELPKIAEREMGAVEGILNDKVEALKSSLKGKFDTTLAKNRKSLGLDREEREPRTGGAGSSGSSLLDGLSGGANALSGLFGDLIGGAVGGASFAGDLANGLGVALAGAVATAEAQEGGGSSAGSKEGLTALFDRIQGSASEQKALKAQETTAVSTAKSVVVQDKLLTATGDLAEDIGEVLGGLLNGLPGLLSK